MRAAFCTLPGANADVPRPVLNVGVDGFNETLLTCLVDTGTLHNRFAVWVAREAGIDLSNTPVESIGVGGRPVIARTVPVALRLGRHTWEAPVTFCEPWPWDFQLLGQEGFLRFFRVTVDAAERRLEITANQR